MNTAEPVGRSLRRPARPTALVVALLLAVAVIVTLVVTGTHGGHVGPPGPGGVGLGAPAGPGDGDGDGDAGTFTDVRAGDADLVVLDGVSGRIQVTADADAHTVTGSFHRGDGVPARIRSAVTGATGRRVLTFGCQDPGGAVTPCAGDLALTVPEHTGLRLRQTSGETVLTRLGGDLTVATASDRFTAQGLHPSRADVTVTSGSADLGFADPPDALTVRATSAAMTLRLPSDAAGGYAVTTAATSADVQVQVPRRADAAHHVSLQVLSGSLAVLPA
ncbi:hypothetical protein GA0115240_14713 [Streptomyces sp. DvalAA-14]|uniref:hypothetical protein n=1 Tax=unclassified Streptomyces TaxID=2593676 RepID=UPI00081B39EC|nr:MULTISPECIES: hypothetical protein [unclassified Streptomyces]MYS23073.1 hypothetical protein [Streptomyces sp. SID4948]SCE26942.1 hypothetical protein GA0115240_14713 [Streptomyces sp. DvalAA-14]